MITVIALILQALISLVSPTNSAVVVIPPMPQSAPAVIDHDDYEWSEFYCDAYDEYADEFTALFNSYSYKLSKNGRSMINGKFVKRGN